MDNDNEQPNDDPEREYYRRKQLYAESDGRERIPDDGPEREYYRRKQLYDQINAGERISGRGREGSNRWRTRRTLFMIGTPVLIILLVGALLSQITKHSNTSSIATATAATPIATKLTPTVLPTPSPTPAPSPTTTPTETPGTVLCDGTVSRWDGWTATPEWTAHNGILSSAGTSSTSTLLTTPCNFDTTHYAIEAKIQIAGILPGSHALPCFHIDPQGLEEQIDNVPTWSGHKIAINCTGNNMIQLIFADMSAPQNSTVEAQVQFNPSLLYHTYRIEVREYNFRLFVDGKLLFDYTDGVEIAGETALDSYHTQVNISSFKVVAL